ncbi:MAG: ceramidase domain-containing protein [Actinomycetia bacterium]|nr:ceramidase domain-containing protein [Actinomycetes bacterium]
MLTALYQRIGESDCETIGSGVFAQPINAVSSLSFSVIGVAAIWWATRVEGNERVVRIVFGVLMVITGAGSVMFHGPQGTGSQFGHDVTFLVTVWFVAVINIAEANRWKRSVEWVAFVAGGVILSLALVLSPGLTNVLMVATVISLVVSDIVLHRRGRLSSWWYVVSLVTIAVAVAMFLLGRTGAPLCDPDSLFQGHGLWHVLAAISLGAYFVATSDSRFTESESANL